MGIFDIFSAAPGQKAAQDQINALNMGKDDLTAQYGKGADALTKYYTAALDPWTKQFQYATQGQQSLADALGMNGPQGNARAQLAFQNNPGYNFQQQQGQNAVLANQARTGMSGSGNEALALQQMGQNLANQGWGDYVGRLQPFLGAGQNAAAGVAGVNEGLGSGLNANYTGLGTNLAGLDTAIGKAQAGGDLAGQEASKNLWGVGMGVLGDITNLAGSSGMAKNLFSKFMA